VALPKKSQRTQSMIVEIKISFPLRQYIPSSVRRLEGGKWDIPKGTKVLKMVEMLGLTEEKSKSLLLLVNGHHVDRERVLDDGDCLHVFPLISGG